MVRGAYHSLNNVQVRLDQCRVLGCRWFAVPLDSRVTLSPRASATTPAPHRVLIVSAMRATLTMVTAIHQAPAAPCRQHQQRINPTSHPHAARWGEARRLPHASLVPALYIPFEIFTSPLK